jgi:hypothetical protein
MKKFLMIALLVVAGTSVAFAQKNSVVGKWQITGFSSEGMSIDLENPASGKKVLAEQLKKETGQTPDSATIEMTYNMMASMFSSMSCEFTQDGQAIFSMPDESGNTKKDIAKYTVDYTAGTLTTIESKDGKQETDVMKIKFEGEYLSLDNTKKGEVLKIKRIK